MRWKRLGRGLLFGLAGFLLSTGLSHVLVLQLYTRHDRSGRHRFHHRHR
ncbi:hypothetical protein KBZ12_10145 [Cyanobium sp. Cruz CV13-4-11]|nr:MULTISPECIES: hypothetical protein [unclassified Cyanobium]MCP9900843.1 hypothetical protein [Cyanobium sp. Cruz CV11-17]MCP9919835.1 hypothetical protein [Cyanobium sp. Cruz CV13-4-11]